MSDINRVVLVGRLTKNPELRSNGAGSKFCRFFLASSRTIYRKDREPKQEVGFYPCIVWGRQAEVIATYLSKGSRVGVDGRLQWSSWADKEGNQKSDLKVLVEELEYLEPKREGNA